MAVPVDEAAVAALPMVGGELVVRYRNAADLDRMERDFGGMGVFVETSAGAPAFAEFSLIQELPDGVKTDPLPARIVQVVPFGEAPGLVVQFLTVPDEVKAQIQAWRDHPVTAAAQPQAEPSDNLDPDPLEYEVDLEPDLEDEDDTAVADETEAEDETEDEGGESRQTVFERVRKMPIHDRSRLAARASKMERSILIRDHEPNVILFLLKNPNLTRGEVVEISKRPTLTHQSVSVILSNKQWAQIEELRYNLVMNPRTPLPLAVKLIPGLHMKHIRELAKNHGVKDRVKKAALRIVLERANK